MISLAFEYYLLEQPENGTRIRTRFNTETQQQSDSLTIRELEELNNQTLPTRMYEDDHVMHLLLEQEITKEQKICLMK